MSRIKYILSFIFFCTVLEAKEYYIRLSSEKIIIISTPDHLSLDAAILAGNYEILNNSSSDSDSQEITDSTLFGEVLSFYQSTQGPTEGASVSSNTIELINICPQQIASEIGLPYRCAIPLCKRRFEFNSGSRAEKRQAHHKTHFKKSFLDSLKSQLVVCPFCLSTMTGNLRTILVHYQRYCSLNK